ncbi:MULTISPECIES: phage head morphogenesis protein [Atopobium]|uniref:Phage head morphogenesis domain-containing protein n=1 Tax=Atopobium minutum 10063974 TaxID=997872 RepID=N2BVU1_9ACTN|nr:MULTISPECIES: phage minor head protein [Atopobium]EMZ42700.1 hypothetical protein HMPREF1091_00258 [Atopobium minutum 10063974]ERL15136.1 protein F-like protein [Atopobium sp. BV3Ac4]
MSDVVHEAADKEITHLARLMAKEFKAAHEDMAKRLEKKLAAYERELFQWQKDLKAGKCTEKEFKAWKNARCADLGQTQGLVELLARDLVAADQRATEHIRGALPAVYTENYNFGSYQAHQGKITPTFALYDEGTVANLLDEDKQLLPAPKVNIPKDMSWNASHVRSALTQSFLTGESIPDMAKRLRGVADMNARSAIRIARTAITGTENRARVDSYVAANDMGINCEKQWMASLDGRTRDSHRVLDGQHVKPDAVFDNGCRFPGDPQAPVGEVYNCRCTLVAYIPGHNTMKDRSEATVGSLSYAEWKAGVREQQPESASGRSLEKFLKLPSVQKRVKASGMSKKKLTDAMRQEMRSQGYQDLRAFKTLPKSRQQGVISKAVERGITNKKNANKAAKADFTRINSPKYLKRFNGLTESKKVNEMIAKECKAMVIHRSGTNSEDLVLVSKKTGKIEAYSNSISKANETVYTDEILEAINSSAPGTLISAHNHPTNIPPTGSDFSAQTAYGYAGGVVALHNGDVYYYEQVGIGVTGWYYDKKINELVAAGMSDYNAAIEVMTQLQNEGRIKWMKL